MTKWNVFNLYKLRIWKDLYKNVESNITDIDSIDDFNFDEIIWNNIINRKIDSELLEGYNQITIKYYTITDSDKDISWKDLYSEITWNSCELKNTTQSYILFVFYNWKINKHLFAITWWYWHHRIKNLINRTFPFTLINKLIDDTWVFWYVKQNNLVWQETFIERGFSSEYDVLSETNYWTVNKEANIKIPKDKLLEIWLDIEEKGKASVLLAKWFKINKRLNFKKFLNIITSITYVLDNSVDKVQLNRIIPIENNQTLEDKLNFSLLNKIKNKPDDIILLPDNEKLFFLADKREIIINGNNYEIEDFNDLIIKLKILDKNNYTNSILNKNFNWNRDEISDWYSYFKWFDINLEVNDTIEKFWIMESLYTDVVVEWSKYIYIHWNFYSLDIKVIDAIKDDFIELLDFYWVWVKIKKILPKKWESHMWEEDYLDIYSSKAYKNNYFVLDKITSENIEFCDLMHISDDWIISLIHAKNKFWNVSRDHSLQALMSCEKIVHTNNSKNKDFSNKIFNVCKEKFWENFLNFFDTEKKFSDALSDKDKINIIILCWYFSYKW